jgi:hypothetical protein
MLGFGAGAWACAGLRSADAAKKNPATNAPSLTHLTCRWFTYHLLVDERGRKRLWWGLNRRSIHFWQKMPNM